MEQRLEKMKVSELREYTREHKLEGRSKPKTKQELIDFILENKSKTKRKLSSSYKSKRSKKKSSPEKSKEDYFIKDTPLNSKQRKYCKCIAHVSAKNDSKCYGKYEEWKKGPKSKDCLNPYVICTKSTNRSGSRFECVPYYNLEAIPKLEIASLAGLHGKKLSEFKKYVKEKQDK
jgi:hypothetical protein